MGKAGKWLRSFLIGKKERDKRTTPPENHSNPVSVRSDKNRWSFRRSNATTQAVKGINSAEPSITPPIVVQTAWDEHSMAMEKATAAAADAALAAAHAAAAVMRLANERAIAIEEDAAATKIQTSFRSYLARKALYALKGLVKLQAVVRGHLVRKQATATLRCMQALITAQARARAQRIKDMEKGLQENIKIVEIDHGEPSKHRNSYSNRPPTAHRYSKQDDYIYHVSRSPSDLTEMIPSGCNGFNTAQSSPQCYSKLEPQYDYSLFPSYMANTESSRAKARSQSTPKQRNPDCLERPASRRRASMEGRNVPRAVRMMQRSSSHITQKQQYPWSIKLDRSTVSLVDSECGSTSTTYNYCRSVAGYDSHGNRY